MGGYYSEKLSAEKLRRCYQVASPRISQYLNAEVDHVLQFCRPNDLILELGCGYGRVVKHLCPRAGHVVGIDTSLASLLDMDNELGVCTNYSRIRMDAGRLGFRDNIFDLVLCIQNGLSAFAADPLILISEAVRVTRPGGHTLFSTYSEKFWTERLKWFYRQSAEGLLGEIDPDQTGDGVIVCKDGFRATTIKPGQFREYMKTLNRSAAIVEVDNSSVFFEIRK
nr:class I SAM-dependent methyltransferase [candidate division Zixibacteria bacterium]